MAKRKISEFTPKSKNDRLNNAITLGGVDSTNIIKDNIQIPVSALIQDITVEPETSGESIIAEETALKDYVLKLFGNTSEITWSTFNTHTLRANVGSVAFSKITGIVPLSQGGTGSNLTLPSNNSLFFNNGTNSSFLEIGTGFTINNGVISTTSFNSPLTNQGDIFVRDNVSDTRFPIGNNGEFLSVDTTQPTRLRWISIDTSLVRVNNGLVAGTLNQRLTTTNKLTKTVSVNDLVLGVNEGALSLSDIPNNIGYLAEIPDSGWRTLYTSDILVSPTERGLTKIDSDTTYQPEGKYRIYGREIKLKGYIVIPAENALGDFEDDYKEYLKGTATFTVSTLSTNVTNNPTNITINNFFDNNKIVLDEDYYFHNIRAFRPVEVSRDGSLIVVYVYCTIPKIIFKTNGSVEIYSIEGFEKTQSSPILPYTLVNFNEVPLKHMIDRVITNNGDETSNFVFDFATHFSAFPTSPSETFGQNIDKSLFTYPEAFDLNNHDFWGGLHIPLDKMCLMLSEDLGFIMPKIGSETISGIINNI